MRDARAKDSPTPAAGAGRWLGVLRQLVRLDWGQLNFHLAARVAPPLAAILALGLVLDDPAGGAAAAGGALVVGFGAFQRFTRTRAAPMLLAAAGMAVSTLLGTLAGEADWSMVLAVLAWGFCCGLLPAIGLGAQWIGQQCAVYLVIAGAYSGDLEHALERTALVLAGALVQLISFASLRFIETGSAFPSVKSMIDEALIELAGLRAHLDWRSPHLQFAVRLAAMLAVTVVLERRLRLPNGYWMTMTALLLARVDFHDTVARGLGRIAGTLIGASLATILTNVMEPDEMALALLVTLFAFFAYATMRLNYGIFAVFLTGYVVLLLTSAGLAEHTTAEDRILATALGGVFALAAHLHYLFRRRGGPG